MFVFSFNTKKIPKKIIIFAAIFLITFVIIIALIFLPKNPESKINYDGGSYNTEVGTVEEISDFSAQFGWKINLQPIEVTEIIVPYEFNDIYEYYNDIQKQQGLDLSKYKGERCRKYTFKVLNYPNSNDVNINLLVFKNRVIGGDISESTVNGFIKKFTN